MDLFSRIAEDKIKEAIKNGELDNLPGMGKPLDLKDDLPGMSAEMKMGYRMLKNAGYISDQVDLRKELITLNDLISAATDDKEIKRLQEKLTRKQLKFEKVMEQRRKNTNVRFGSYAEKIYGKLK
ncbi:DnaJ family domain-containing protein [Neobacillus drentensis]|uniref:DnaJ family domain-containing protein n=1 Tax=Neobacillus drentensis TaxID=220684 RepID=UPI002861CD4B|nr:DnaJ family domain-containing protein [Neobacillus drentensis]MDR7236680.1 septation ring formation regulator EzrA [Neobacillus drentensis]